MARAHKWVKRLGFVMCSVCGTVRRRDHKNKPCRGAVKLRALEPALKPPGPEDG